MSAAQVLSHAPLSVLASPMNILHNHPAPGPLPPSKRRRTPTPTLQTIPQQCLRQILRHLLPGTPTASSLRPLLPLRTVCKSLRDAFDVSITALDLSDLPPRNFPPLLRILPRLKAITNMSLPPHALTDALLPRWRDALPPLRRLTYVAPSHDTTAQLFGDRLMNSLEVVSTTSPILLAALSGRCGVHTLEVLMDQVDPGVLAGFPAVLVRLLYRSTIRADIAESLLMSLQRMNRLQAVELRMNNLSSDMYGMFPHIPHLRKLSLFDGCILPTERGVRFIASCEHLDELHLEWIRGLSGEDMLVLAKGLGERLRKLRIWNCDRVSDEGLVAVALYCPNVEVELRFVREQFGGAALAAFGERVSWASSM